MIVPLVVLAIGAALAGVFNLPEQIHHVGGFLGHFLAQSPSFVFGHDVASRAMGPTVQAAHFGLEKAGEAPESPWAGLALGGALSIAGILLAYLLHLRDRGLADRLARSTPWLTDLVENKYYVDEFYHAYIVEPLWFLGEIFFAIDRFIVDGLVNLMGWIPQLSGFTLKLTVQRGYLQGYATTMLFGVMIILLLVFLY
jgi:NADH-quinone oxidoreductase subunit L